ncbi:undecaprenol kinase [Gracilibacillus halophilus YIM-C55.5]|uniref:Undecaprenol kinase n=1 Tax=Gracilibacillus halophilus YIM-C55.5 TaxID=1308866 RepID=N4WE38_9BACI|nr:diacylglycerol kinase family protein [Gracilibacillus halophilus]ENH97504.1 undecaprenol kinase [Gracilibacillus halophilus YIM-C55.5]
MASVYRGKHTMLRAFRFAFDGLKLALATERNVKIHIFVASVVIIAGLLSSLSVIEWVLLSLTISSVIAFELVNTAIETALDYLSPEWSKEIGQAKDLAAAAVFVVTIASVCIACFIFLPKWF